VIGAFTVGAAVLAVGAVLLFGSGRIFSDTQKYVLYFEESLKGLTVGSPVTLAGVQIGSVTDIRVEFDLDELSYRAPVIIEVDRDTFARVRPSQDPARQARLDARRVSLLIEEGLRAQLQTRSFVTGMLQVALDFHPETEAKLTGGRAGYPEIPTIPTTMEQLSRTLESLPIEELVTNLQQVAKGLDELVNSPHLGNTVALLEETLQNLQAITGELGNSTEGVTVQVRAAIADVRTVADSLNRQIEPLSSAAIATLEQGQRLLKSADETTVPRLNALLEHADGRIDPLAAGLTKTIASAEATLDEATRTLRDVGQAAAGAPGVRQELTAALRELASAARAMRQLAEYLERHPESLLHGKGGR
jgi:paraquat-inducible protein B